MIAGSAFFQLSQFCLRFVYLALFESPCRLSGAFAKTLLDELSWWLWSGRGWFLTKNFNQVLSHDDWQGLADATLFTWLTLTQSRLWSIVNHQVILWPIWWIKLFLRHINQVLTFIHFVKYIYTFECIHWRRLSCISNTASRIYSQVTIWMILTTGGIVIIILIIHLLNIIFIILICVIICCLNI